MLDALIAQYMVSDRSPEVIMITEQTNADGLVVKIDEQKLADLKTVPVGQHQSMLQECEFCQCTIPRTTVPFPMTPLGVRLEHHRSSFALLHSRQSLRSLASPTPGVSTTLHFSG